MDYFALQECRVLASCLPRPVKEHDHQPRLAEKVEKTRSQIVKQETALHASRKRRNISTAAPKCKDAHVDPTKTKTTNTKATALKVSQNTLLAPPPLPAHTHRSPSLPLLSTFNHLSLSLPPLSRESVCVCVCGRVRKKETTNHSNQPHKQTTLLLLDNKEEVDLVVSKFKHAQ